MLHACNAVDGTARKVYPALGVGARFKKLLRENYVGILEPMMVPGVNLAETVFPVSISGASGPGGRPDVADILYVIHRCHHGHGKSNPAGRVGTDTRHHHRAPAHHHGLRGPERGMDSSPQRPEHLRPGRRGTPVTGQRRPGPAGQPHRPGLLDSPPISHVRLDNGWWGRADDFAAITAMDRKRISLTVDFSNVIPSPAP